MRLIITLCIFFVVTSCSREVHQPIDSFYFSVNGLTKAKLLVTLDEFAKINDFEKIQEGDGKILPKIKKGFLLVVYKNKEGYEFKVNNILNKVCFSVRIYGKNKVDNEAAFSLSRHLNKWLGSNYQDKFALHENQHCKN